MEINSEKTFIDRLIVVDDEEDIRLLLRDTLQDHYDLSVQEGGEDAIACVRQSLEMNKPFSVAIMDLNMPGMDGITTAMKIRELDERIHLILMAGESRNILETLDESLKNNLILVRKPFAIYDVFMLTQYLCKTWQMARTLEVRSAELSTKIHQSESIRANIEAIFETALDSIITIDHQSRVTEWNPAAEKTFGYTREEILGLKLSDTIIPTHHRTGHLEGMERHPEFGGGPILGKRIEITALDKSGREFPVELAVTQIHNKEKPGFTAYLRDISAQRAAEQQMKLQSKTLEAAANGIIITNADSRMVWANPAFLRLTGYEMDEVIGEKMSLLKSKLNTKAYYDDLWATIKSGKVWQGEIINRRKDGSHYTEDMTITPVTDTQGQILNYIAIKQDVTERKLVNEQLIQNEKSQRIINYFATSLAGSNSVEEILWDIAESCISEIGLEDAVVYMLDSEKKMLVQRAAYGENKAKERMIVNPISIPIGQGIVGSVAAEMKPIVVDDLASDSRYIVDDQIRRSELAVPIIYENRVIGVIDSEHTKASFFTDYHVKIFEAIASLAANKIMRIISQERTEKSELKYRSIFESIQDVYAEVDFETGKILEISPSIEPFSGFTRQEVIGQNLTSFYAPPGPPQTLSEALASKGKVNDFEVTLLDKGGFQRTVSWTASLLRDEDNKPTKIVGTMRDITERKQAEKALKESVHIKTNFVSNVSHELRTPMASILGFAGTILRDKDMPDDTKMDFVRIINEEAQRLTRLIENVLDISRMEAGTINYKLRSTQLEGIISEVIDSQIVLAQKKGVTLVSHVGKDLPAVMAAPDAISQMAVNLISNAIKFTESSGTVEVSLNAEKENLVFEVRDNGLGIPEADLSKIFDKFYRVEREKREDEGTGIGLSIVKEIVDKHNAKLEVESEVGKGTLFRILIPIMG